MSPVSYKIDWFSFTVPTYGVIKESKDSSFEWLRGILLTDNNALWEPMFIGKSWKVKSRSIASAPIIVHPDCPLTVSGSVKSPHIQVDISGQACDYIRSLGMFNDFMQFYAHRANRVDLATDIETQEDFVQFIRNLKYKAVKTHVDYASDKGDTVYIGAWKSEKFVRVYRYHKPHPRSHLTRIEIVMKRKYAKQAAQMAAHESEVAAVKSGLAGYKFAHPDYDLLDGAVSTFKSKQTDRDAASKLLWLKGQVIPALLKMHGNHEVDVIDLLYKEVFVALGFRVTEWAEVDPTSRTDGATLS